MIKLTNEQIEKKLREMACLLGERNDKRPKDQLTWKAATALREQEEEILSLRQEVEFLKERLDKAHDLLMDSDYNPAFITAQFGEKEQGHDSNS